ncbi:unnamed protein product [Prunus armeniaca]
MGVGREAGFDTDSKGNLGRILLTWSMPSRRERPKTRPQRDGDPHPPPPPPHPEGVGEVDPNLQQVLDQFTRTVATALQGRHPNETLDIKRAKDLGARDFQGNADLVEADYWLTDLVRVFEVMRCPMEDRNMFYGQFRPRSYCDAKQAEFLRLRQGTMLVLEYEHKFNELSRFCLEIVPNE